MTANQQEKRRAWLVATRRRNEIVRLARHRAAVGEPIDERDFLFVLAATLASAPAGRFRINGRIGRFLTWHGLDRVSLCKAASSAGFPLRGTEDPLVGEAFDRLDAAFEFSPDSVGQLLSLRADERDLLKIVSIEAIDEDKRDRDARRREERRTRDRERKRKDREGLHRPRSESLSSTRPWEAAGISRRTYERRAKRDANLSATARSDANLSVTQICPRMHVVKGTSDRIASSRDDLHRWLGGGNAALGARLAAEIGAKRLEAFLTALRDAKAAVMQGRPSPASTDEASP